MSVSRETTLLRVAIELGLDSAQSEKLLGYALLLETDASRLGLIGFGPHETPAHLVRALLLKDLIEAPDWADVGSGAGLPGIPLSIALGAGHLIEPKVRAVAFLEKARRELGLDFEVSAESAESLSRKGNTFGGVVARALASPRRALEMCLPLCGIGGRVVLTASPDATLGEEVLAGLPARLIDTVVLRGPLDIQQRAHIIGRLTG